MLKIGKKKCNQVLYIVSSDNSYSLGREREKKRVEESILAEIN